MDKFHEYCKHLEAEVESMMHDVMQDEAPHIDDIMIIGEMIDQIKDIYKIKCMEKEMDGNGYGKADKWDKE